MESTLPPLRPCTASRSSRGLCPAVVLIETSHPSPSSYTPALEGDENVYIRPIITFFGMFPPLRLFGAYSNRSRTTIELEDQELFVGKDWSDRMRGGYLPLDVIPAVGEQLTINVYDGKRVKGVEGTELVVGVAARRAGDDVRDSTAITYRWGNLKSEYPESGVRVERKKRRKKHVKKRPTPPSSFPPPPPPPASPVAVLLALLLSILSLVYSAASLSVRPLLLPTSQALTCFFTLLILLIFLILACSAAFYHLFGHTRLYARLETQAWRFLRGCAVVVGKVASLCRRERRRGGRVNRGRSLSQ